ncbi:hypothetical protein Tco_0298069, partial [Tanacetum coccineum]
GQRTVLRPKGSEHDEVITDEKDGAGTQGCRAGNPSNGSTSKDEALFLSTTGEDLKTVLRARWNIEF